MEDKIPIVLETVRRGQENYDRTVQDLRRVNAEVEGHSVNQGKAQRAIKATGDVLGATAVQAKALTATLIELAGPLLALAGIFEGFQFVKGLFESGIDDEKMLLQLTFLTGTTEKAREELEKLGKLSTDSNFFSVNQLVQAERVLGGTTKGVLELTDALNIASDAAVATGQDISSEAEQMARIFAAIRSGNDLSFGRAGGATGLITQSDVERLRIMKEAGASIAEQLQFAVERMRVFQGATAAQASTFGGLALAIKAIIDQLKGQFIEPILKALIPLMDSVATRLRNLLESGTVTEWGRNIVATVNLVTESIKSGNAGEILGLMLEVGIEKAIEYLKTAFQAALTALGEMAKIFWSSDFGSHALVAFTKIGQFLTETMTASVAALLAGLMVAASAFANDFQERFVKAVSDALKQIEADHPFLALAAAKLKVAGSIVSGVQNAVTGVATQYQLGPDYFASHNPAQTKADLAADTKAQEGMEKVTRATLTYEEALRKVQAGMAGVNESMLKQLESANDIFTVKKQTIGLEDQLASEAEKVGEEERQNLANNKPLTAEKILQAKLAAQIARDTAAARKLQPNVTVPIGDDVAPQNQNFAKAQEKLKVDLLKAEADRIQSASSMREAAEQEEILRFKTQQDEIKSIALNSVDERNALIRQAELIHTEKLKQIEKADAQQRIQTQTEVANSIGSTFGSMADAAKLFGKQGFAAWKAFALAQAIVSGAAAVVQQLGGGDPYSAPFRAAAAAAAAAVQIATIAATEPQGYQGGGWTAGSEGQVAGIVHGHEVVIPAPEVRSRGVGHFAQYFPGGRMPGYAGGGYVQPISFGTGVGGAMGSSGGGSSVGITVMDVRSRNDLREALANGGMAMIIDGLKTRGNTIRL